MFKPCSVMGLAGDTASEVTKATKISKPATVDLHSRRRVAANNANVKPVETTLRRAPKA